MERTTVVIRVQLTRSDPGCRRVCGFCAHFCSRSQPASCLRTSPLLAQHSRAPLPPSHNSLHTSFTGYGSALRVFDREIRSGMKAKTGTRPSLMPHI
ncbi:hypothetical protein AG1IA_03734 [Rhizoctonia solani AG-1 IA]|uniref:Uncharacterized protein n=1 Tax=Thanatephorus cucumeris (strain AG1-IA) TaxID=983506 RepID=L8WZJ0_THACA|nr:hypothetical protein AG1IA_03734 [Rhizoctonia solani AG-1 IA]